MRTTRLATVNEDGSRHVTAVGAVWADGMFWFQEVLFGVVLHQGIRIALHRGGRRSSVNVRRARGSG